MTGKRAHQRESIEDISIGRNALLAGVNAKAWRRFQCLFFLFCHAFFLSFFLSFFLFLILFYFIFLGGRGWEGGGVADLFLKTQKSATK